MLVVVWFEAVVVALTNFQDNAQQRAYVLPLQYAATIWIAGAGWRVIDEKHHSFVAPLGDQQ